MLFLRVVREDDPYYAVKSNTCHSEAKPKNLRTHKAFRSEILHHCASLMLTRRAGSQNTAPTLQTS